MSRQIKRDKEGTVLLDTVDKIKTGFYCINS